MRTCPHRIGKIVQFHTNDNPNTLWPSTTWQKIENCFLFGSDSSHSLGSTGGEESVTLTKEQSALPSHGHSFTQPTVNGGGGTNNITGGSHTHTGQGNCYIGGLGGDGSRQAYARNKMSADPNNNTAVQASTHTHSVPNHTHSVSGGAVSNNGGANASQAHDNMPPYIVVHCWKRVA